MAAPGFGFSVGDFVAGVSLIRKLIRAVNDTAGSRAAYRKLISELLNLEEALGSINKLQLSADQEPQKLVLQAVAAQCQTSIETFISDNVKFSQSLGVQSLTTLPAWRVNLHKIQWALCRDKAVEDLRTEIAAHTATLNLNIATIQVSAAKLQERNLDNCTELVQSVYDETKRASARDEQNQQTLIIHTGLMETISRTITGLVSGQQENGLLSLVHKALRWNIKIFDAVTQMQKMLSSVPPQIERQQPVLFEDAHGRLTPFHIEFINSYTAFQAVLETRFENMPGLRKVKRLEYAMQDTQSKRILDLSGPWESNMRPGRKFVMSMVFQLTKAVISSCPGCFRETSNYPDNEDSDIQCDNPDCRMIFRCITNTGHPQLGKRKRSDSCDSPAKRAKHRREGDSTDENDPDRIQEFRRVQIVQEEHSSSTEHPDLMSSESPDEPPSDAELTDTIEIGPPLTGGPIVHEFDRRISHLGSQLFDTRDISYPSEILGGARSFVLSASSNQLIQRNSEPWSSLASFESVYRRNIDGSIPAVDPYSRPPLPLPPPRYVDIDGPQAAYNDIIANIHNRQPTKSRGMNKFIHYSKSLDNNPIYS